jgi:hypothetical protein
MSKKSRNNLIIIGSVLGIVLLVVLLAFVFKGGVKESIFSLSDVNVGTDGKVYWIVTASANNPNETYIFSQTFSTYTKTDGTQVTPKNPLTLVVSPISSKCIYQTQQYIAKKSTFLFLTKDIPYYVLSNTQRVVNFDVTDSYGQTKNFDGTVIDSKTFSNSNGNAVVQTQGILSGKYNCPEYSNVVLLNKADLNLGTGYLFGYKSEFDSWVAGGSTQNVNDNTQFTSSFQSYPLFNGTTVYGDYRQNLGFAVFTITADQNYFNSVVYVPPKEPYPVVSTINVASQIEKSKTSSMNVVISNNNANAGTILLSTSSNLFSVSPQQINTILPASGSVTQSFTLTAQSTTGCGDITITACSTGQFSTTKNCNSKSSNVCIVSSSTNLCGNGVCDSYENSATCSQDCYSPTPVPQQECKWYQSSTTTSSKGFLGLFPSTANTCSLNGWIVLGLFAVVIAFLIFVYLLFRRLIKVGINKFKSRRY